VELRYRPLEPDPEDPEEEPDFEGGLLAAVDELARIDTGDILLFMPTEHHIHEAAKLLRGHAIPWDSPARKTEILPLYARLSAAEQNRIFQGHKHRRIVIATNVAESSLTVPGIRYVIDPGTARISRYSARSKMQRLPIEPVSQASADQRMGRCGRVAPGVCIRLYSEEDYAGRDRYTPPEIQRSNLASVILQTKALKLGDIEEFPFLDPPRADAVRDGYKTLFELGALDEANRLTDLGQQLARLPVDPRIGRIVLAGHAENCLHEVLIIASALETQDPRDRPLEKKGSADEAHARFAHEESDFLGYLKLWDFWQKLKGDLSRNQLRHACRQNFLSYNRMREWVDVHRQLLELVEEAGLKQQSRRDDYAAIHRALLAGLLSNIALRGDGHEYTVAGGGKCVLWPGSGVFAGKPKWIVAAEQVETSRRFLRTVARINPEWIEPLAGHLVSRSHSDPYWQRRGASVMCQERVSLMGLSIVSGRRVPYGPIAPGHARELFIQHALVEGDYPHTAAFLEHNRRLVVELETLQTKIRRRDLLLGEEARFDFYDRRIPEDVWDGHTFERWRRSAERKEPRLLYLAPADLLREETAAPDARQFPDRLAVRAMELPLAYHFDPGSASDGVTLTVPREALGQIDRQQLGWLVPGLLEEKVVALIKSLPKQLRRNFVPAAETARQVVSRLQFGEGNLVAAVADQLSRIAGERVPLEAFQLDSLPTHLQMNVRVVDLEGKAVAEARDLGQLREELGESAELGLKDISDPRFAREGLTTWDFDELPESVEIQRRGLSLRAFPALVDRGQRVSLQLADSADRAARETRAGLRRLFALAAARELKAQTAWLPGLDQWRLYAATLPDAGRLAEQLADLIADRAFLADQPLPRTQAEFEAQLRRGRNRIAAAVQDVTNLAGPLLEAYHQARVALEQTVAPRFQYAVVDIRSQLDHLVSGGFLTLTPWEWLLHYPRYLRAIRQRLEKLTSDGLLRDQRSCGLLARRLRAYEQRVESHRQQDLVDPELLHYRWMLEEYRVSLFAQKLGTSLTVSEKRLDEQWDKVVM
jgi:ATP-dependent helicase HrpA